ncbi:TPA: type I toxin-antitoxin system Fst family toxin [Streptococcus suis]|nr:type I toxin-antitoxin system Fst family toxin [Streptococcus suis]MBY4986672.1 type I toxin-antitoxin system Fst family toxin [Streptococcus suis]MBY5039806.1 type I toxin-antitoxin system Fst family toxin [Streptococcus suis]MCK3882691.1 type I toxin-antitoxin system Fst family toxin [Streptococcus suis]NQK46062.1 type I toxin-antitoxin system Fst family toxin [Streptococcus suis]HEM5998162.1 type I toxin-antitoxin system Fst family toxin [Streptococcus suis]
MLLKVGDTVVELILTAFFLPLFVGVLTSLFEYWLNNRNK